MSGQRRRGRTLAVLVALYVAAGAAPRAAADDEVAAVSAGGPTGDEKIGLPQTLGFGHIPLGALSLKPTLNVQWVGFAEGNPGFGGQWSSGPVNQADKWFETSNEVGLNARYDAGELGTLRARVSGVFSLSGGGLDAASPGESQINNHSYSLESANLTWQSGNLFPALGFNALEIGGGDQNYQIFDGLLFWDGAADRGSRGGAWLTARKAFRDTGIVRLNLGVLSFEGVHLRYNDDPDTHTRLVGTRVEIAENDRVVKHVKLGFMFFDIYDSKTVSRNGLNCVYGYSEATPLRSLPDLTATASYVFESNSKVAGLTDAVGWYVAPAYEFSRLPWKPQLFYRYASFSGGGTRNFDPLFPGLPDWGAWFQGEVLGEFALSNSNLNSDQVRLELQPNDILTINLIYYKFLLFNRSQSLGVVPSTVASRALADEVDLILDVSLAHWWTLTGTFALAVPNDGFRQAVGGSSTWISSMLYTNFNF
jgi:hypothetical protein